MSSAVRRSGGGLFEGLYRVLMRRNSVYVTFVIAGAFAGERAVDYGVHKLWEMNNLGEQRASSSIEFTEQRASSSIEKRYEDIPVLGQRPAE